MNRGRKERRGKQEWTENGDRRREKGSLGRKRFGKRKEKWGWGEMDIEARMRKGAWGIGDKGRRERERKVSEWEKL